ncbi:hypothetical protein HIM_02405 [Hirsutella minnesotensis 3608]|nr:hypothetical protein HIM_02405 [Hirsutella minnesotensis 3608]
MSFSEEAVRAKFPALASSRTQQVLLDNALGALRRRPRRCRPLPQRPRRRRATRSSSARATSSSSRPSTTLLPEDLARLVSPRTRLVACTHVSNILGTITNVKAIAHVAHSVGALVCVDGVAYAPHLPVDVQELGVDMYVFSWYKVYGAHVATLYVSWSAQLHVKSLGHFFNPSTSLADKLGLSAASYELCQSVTHVVDYLGPASSDMWMGIAQQESKLQSALLDFLRERPEVTIYGVTQGVSIRRVPTISFTVRGWDSKDFVEAVEKDSIYCFRWGSFYSNRLVRDTLRLGENGVVRVSMVHYNTLDEVNGLVKALEKVILSKN